MASDFAHCSSQLCEISNVLILLSFRRIHVLTHALSLLFIYLFSSTTPLLVLPSPSSPSSEPSPFISPIPLLGLGLRRV